MKQQNGAVLWLSMRSSTVAPRNSFLVAKLKKLRWAGDLLVIMHTCGSEDCQSIHDNVPVPLHLITLVGPMGRLFSSVSFRARCGANNMKLGILEAFSGNRWGIRLF